MFRPRSRLAQVTAQVLRRMASTSSNATKRTIELDGSTLEGGGQLMRNAVGLSALTRTPVHIRNVRQGRDQPGLKAQHAAGLDLVKRICNAQAEGIEKGSTTVSFDPTQGFIRAGEYEADPGTAGSTMLLYQVSLPCLLFPEPAPSPSSSDGEVADAKEEPQQNANETGMNLESTLTLRGGTNAIHAPPIDFSQHVLLPFLSTHILPSSFSPSSTSSSSSTGRSLRLDLKQRGFFPHGGGLLRATLPSLRRGETLRSLKLLDRGTLLSIEGRVVVSGAVGKKVANELRAAALETIYFSPQITPLLSSTSTNQQVNINIDIESHPKGTSGSSIFLLARTSTDVLLSGSAIGSGRVRASQTGREAAEELLKNLEEGGCVDCWMQDQMIVFLALAKGRSEVRTGKVTLHTRTAIWVAEQLTNAKFEVSENVDGTDQAIISCEGIGLEGRL